MQWLDREFWNLYKSATDPRSQPSSACKNLNQNCAVARQLDSTSSVNVSANTSVSTASEWSPEEQRRLEAALLTHSSSLEPKQRWQLIATDVGSKTTGQCIARFKFIRDTLKSGGSVALAEAKAAAALTASDKSAPAKVAPTTTSVPAPTAPAATASESPMKMPPIEIPDDLLAMTGVMAGAGMCAGGLRFLCFFHCIVSKFQFPFKSSSSPNGGCGL